MGVGSHGHILEHRSMGIKSLDQVVEVVGTLRHVAEEEVGSQDQPSVEGAGLLDNLGGGDGRAELDSNSESYGKDICSRTVLSLMIDKGSHHNLINNNLKGSKPKPHLNSSISVEHVSEFSSTPPAHTSSTPGTCPVPEISPTPPAHTSSSPGTCPGTTLCSSPPSQVDELFTACIRSDCPWVI